MLFEEAKTPLDAAKRLEPGQKVRLQSAIGNRTIVLCITEIAGNGKYVGDQVESDPLDHRPFNNESRMKKQHFKWKNVLEIIAD